MAPRLRKNEAKAEEELSTAVLVLPLGLRSLMGMAWSRRFKIFVLVEGFKVSFRYGCGLPIKYELCYLAQK